LPDNSPPTMSATWPETKWFCENPWWRHPISFKERQRDIKKERHTDRETDRHKDWETETDRDRQRQTEKQELWVHQQ
jgi:hypothetical protein